MIDRMIIDIISEILNTDSALISKDTLILEDLGANSLDIIEIITEIEDCLKITIPDDVIPGFKTVGDLSAYVESQK
ncbi:MAG: acyl carrier protein [Clostridia bacterium]|nr:acyl carrier protein [Clostridia bacterium]